MEKGTLLSTISDINFWYGGYNENGWQLVYTHNENFHVKKDRLDYPVKRDCERIYRNYYA